MNNITRIAKTLGLILVLTVSTTMNSWAVNGSTDTASTGLSKKISRQLSFPSELIRSEFSEQVMIDFRINNDGTVEIINVHTKSFDLKNHVIEQFKKLQIDDVNIDNEKVYQINVKYRVI
jgi:hypothetical protein